MDEDDAPTLTSMPAEIMGHIVHFLADDLKNVPVLLSLKRTCRSFYNLLARDEVWETLFPSCENIMQHCWVDLDQVKRKDTMSQESANDADVTAELCG